MSKYEAGAQHWTDSLGISPYLDFECTPPVDPNDPNELPVVSGVTRYLAASAQQKLDSEGEPLETRYYHGDLIDSTCLTTDETGAPNSGGGAVSTVAYTAYGEVIAANGTANSSTGSALGSVTPSFEAKRDLFASVENRLPSSNLISDFDVISMI